MDINELFVAYGIRVPTLRVFECNRNHNLNETRTKEERDAINEAMNAEANLQTRHTTTKAAEELIETRYRMQHSFH